MTPRKLLRIYRWLFVSLIVIASVQPLNSAGIPAHPPGILLLAGVEILAALLLLSHRCQKIGLALLLPVLGMAQTLTALHGTMPTHFLQYAASAVLIVWLDHMLPRG